MSLNCPKCNKSVAAADVNVQADVARCSSCGEVFRASAALGAPPASATVSSEPPRPDRLPEGSRVRIEQQGSTTVVRFPPSGFNWGLVFLIAFAIAWWSFLLVFVGLGAAGMFHSDQPADESALTTDVGHKAPAETPSADGGNTFKNGMSCFVGLFLTPFVLAGFAMLFGILWPLFGRTEVRIEGRDCLYRASLFGIGRTRRALRDDTTLRWSEEVLYPNRRGFGVLMRQQMTTPVSGDAHMLLALGSQEKPVGGAISRREQEYVYHVLRAALGQAESPPPAEAETAKAAPPPKIVSWERGPDGSVSMVLLPRGFGGESVGLFAFAAFWNIITITVSGGFLLGMAEGDVLWLLTLFFVPFWMVGIGVPFWACWLSWGKTELVMDRSGVTLARRLFGRQLVRQYAAQDVESFTQEVSYSSNNVPTTTCHLAAGRKKVNFGHTLSPPDQQWVVASLNEAAKDLGLGR